MKRTSLFIGIILAFSFTFNGCGSSGGSNEGATSSPTIPSIVNVVIKGAVNDAPIAFAKVRLVVNPSGKELASITADANGKWSYTVDKSTLPADSFIMIYATNPGNDVVIRSMIDTDEVIASTKNFETDETTVSHYTEAAVSMAEIETGINQVEFNKIKSLIVLDNDKPTDTGLPALDNLAKVIQTSFDDNKSSQDKLNLSVYKQLLQEQLSKVFPDKFGKVTVPLPIAYNDKINIEVSLSTGSLVTIVDDTITFELTPQEIQLNVNLTIQATLNNNIIRETITLYAKGNSKNHYIYNSVAPSSQPNSSTVSVMINGRYYTLIPYSYTSIEKSNANINPITINGSVRGKSFNTLKIANNYLNTKTLIKIYEGKGIFDSTTLVGDSGIKMLAFNQINIGNVNVTRVDDFRPIAPKDTNIELPPVAPEF